MAAAKTAADEVGSDGRRPSIEKRRIIVDDDSERRAECECAFDRLPDEIIQQ